MQIRILSQFCHNSATIVQNAVNIDRNLDFGNRRKLLHLLLILANFRELFFKIAFASIYAHIFIFSFDFTPFELVPETMFPYARNPFFLLVPLACGIAVNFRDRHFYFHFSFLLYTFQKPTPWGPLLCREANSERERRPRG